MLSANQRLEQTLRAEAADRAPCICPGGMMNMITTDLMDLCGISWPEAHTDARMMADLAQASYENGCFDNVGVPFCMTVEAEALGAAVTMGTRVYEPHVTGYCIDSVSQWQELKPLDVTSGRPKVVLDAIALLRDRKLDAPIVGNLTGPISTASSVMEPVTFYKELRKKNADAHAFLAFVTDQLICFARSQIAAGATVIAISDPSGTGEILGGKAFQEFAVTYLNRLLDGIADTGVHTIVHICGQMHSVYPQINQVHSDVLSFDSVVPMQEARKNLPGRILMGNVSTYTLEFGTPEKVAQLTRNCLQNGSNILSPACGLGTRSPLKNIQAIRQALDAKEAQPNA